MVFSSLTFLTLFLPTVLLAAWTLSWIRAPVALQNAWLLAASLAFYFWGEGWGVAWLAGSILFNAACAAAVARAAAPLWRKTILAAAIVGDLSLLVWFKYAAWTVRSLNLLPGLSLPVPAVALPLGISFYSFQAMSYVVDVYRRTLPPARRWLDFACYLSLFPQLVAGPIVRYADVAAPLAARSFRLPRVASGLRRFLLGLAKKVLLANPAGAFADSAWTVLDGGGALPPSLAWIALLAFSLQIYFDFSGYSDMAIGLGRMLGFEFPENFLHPYTATSVRDFWRKWHISLSTWFRDYLYIPLGGNRRGPARAALNSLVVFALCGLWHGAGTLFLVWGLWHGAFLVLEHVRPLPPLPSRFLPSLPRRLYALAVVAVGWVFFRCDSWSAVARMAASLSGLAHPAPAARALWIDLSPLAVAALAAAVLVSAPLAARVRLAARRFLPPLAAAAAEWSWLTLLGLLALLVLAGGSFNPFLYFRF